MTSRLTFASEPKPKALEPQVGKTKGLASTGAGALAPTYFPYQPPLLVRNVVSSIVLYGVKMRLSEYLDAMNIERLPGKREWNFRYSHITKTPELKKMRSKIKRVKNESRKGMK